MYNGIGLQSARGSGTSGHIQKNQSHQVKKTENLEEFLKKLQELRKNNLPPPRKANQQIIQHERKRQIMIQVMKLRQKLEDQGMKEEEIQQKVKKAQQLLKAKLQSGQLQTKARDTHILTQAKQKEYMKLSQAFGIQKNDEIGSAFNFAAQRQNKLKEQYKKSLKQKFVCPHENCGKKYAEVEYLDRHLKYKHPKQIQEKKQKLSQVRHEQNERTQKLHRKS